MVFTAAPASADKPSVLAVPTDSRSGMLDGKVTRARSGTSVDGL